LRADLLKTTKNSLSFSVSQLSMKVVCDQQLLSHVVNKTSAEQQTHRLLLCLVTHSYYNSHGATKRQLQERVATRNFVGLSVRVVTVKHGPNLEVQR